METTPRRDPTKVRRILPPRSQNQGDLTSDVVNSRAYSGRITRSRVKTLTYAEVTLQSSVTTFDQRKDQLEEQDEVTKPAFYDVRTLFQEEGSSSIILHGRIIEDDQAENMPVLLTSTPSLKE